MKRVLTVLLFWVCVSSGWAQTPERLDRENGFRGISFGTSGSLIPGLYPVQARYDGQTQLAVYGRPDDSLMLGTVPLLAVRFLLMQKLNWRRGGQTDALYGVKLEAAAATATALLQELETRYGPGQRAVNNRGETEWRWSGELVELTYRLAGSQAQQPSLPPSGVEVSVYHKLLHSLANRMPVCGLNDGALIPERLPLLKQKQ